MDRLRNKIVKLMYKIEKGKNLVEMEMGVKEKRSKEVMKYEKFLNEIEKWISNVNDNISNENRKE
jgi:hypothetical protein